MVLNKIDLVAADRLAEVRRELTAALDWDGPVYEIAAVNGAGTDTLCADIMTRLELLRDREAQDPEAAAEELASQRQLQAEARERVAELRARRRGDDEGADDDD